jgi:hypothetical protein
MSNQNNQPQIGTVQSLIVRSQGFDENTPESVRESNRLLRNDAELALIMSQANEMIPKAYQGKPNAIFIAMQFARDLGIPVIHATRHIASVNGQLQVYGDMQLALAQKHERYEDIIETFSEETKSFEISYSMYQQGQKKVNTAMPLWAQCEIKIKGRASVIRRYTLAMAETNPNFNSGKFSPWVTNPTRMMQMRARSWALRDSFPDILHGVYTPDEGAEIRMTRDVTEAVNEATSAKEFAPVDKKAPTASDLFEDAPEQSPVEATKVEPEPPKTEPAKKRGRPKKQAEDAPEKPAVDPITAEYREIEACLNDEQLQAVKDEIGGVSFHDVAQDDKKEYLASFRGYACKLMLDHIRPLVNETIQDVQSRQTISHKIVVAKKAQDCPALKGLIIEADKIIAKEAKDS